jgi:hypothetical protein
VRSVSHGIDRIAVTFDEPGHVANAGLVLVATLVKRLGLEQLVDTMVAGATHIDHADVLRAGATGEVSLTG